MRYRSCNNPGRSRRFSHKDLRTDRVTHRPIMMFVLGAFWAQDPPREVLGLKAKILAKNCKSDVKTPHFAGTGREVVNKS